MASPSIVLSAPNPSWFTPKRLLGIFCVINLLNYVDRGVIASNGVNGSPRTCTQSGTCSSGSGIQGDFNLSNFEDGVISSAFMVGLLVASPIFASLAKSINPFRLIGVGLTVWTFATAGCGFSLDFWSITICRMLVGVGEASFVSLAASFIDDNAPVAQKTAWLGIFYMCIPAGVALGYVYGGLVGGHLNWRWAFWVEAILMLPFAVLGFVMKPLQLRGFPPAGSKNEKTAVEIATSEDQDISYGKGCALSIKEESSDQSSIKPSRSNGSRNNLNQFSRIWKDMKVLLVDKVYVVNVLGYIAYNFVIGAYSYWGPKAGYNIYHMSNADLVFGGVTVVCGIFGTLGGGYALDLMTSTISNAFKLISAAAFMGAIFCFSAFCFKSLYVFIVLLAIGELLIFATQLISAAAFMGAIFCFSAFCFKSLYVFIVLLAIGELLIFATQGPVNFICLHCVKPSLRPLSIAMSTVSIHVFGDVISSPLVGVLQDNVNNWRVTALILTSVMFLAAAMWFIGIFLHSVDRSDEDIEHPGSMFDESNTTPLLEEGHKDYCLSLLEP